MTTTQDLITAQDLAGRYFRIKAKRDRKGTQAGLPLQNRMIQVIDRAIELGMGTEFMTILLERCPTPNKYSFPTEKSAKPVNRTAMPLRPYPCRCGAWHVTTKSERIIP